jgi:hypothetical protein
LGGKLFHLPRMPRAEYLVRESAVRAYLDERLPGAYRVPRYYGDKADFGDMDVLVASRPDWGAVREEIVRDLGITDVKVVGHVFSTVFRGLQTDFFTVPAAYLDAMFSFMSFNDVGNFIGRICRRFDLKYGERGLSYVYRYANGNTKLDLEITQDFARICAFLGLDHARWRAGFATLPDVFDWVIASRYFSVAPYLDGDDRTMRKRAEERPTVARFVAYLRERGIDKRIDLGDRKDRLPDVYAAFPDADLPARIAAARQTEARHMELRRRFNGERVMRLVPGIQGKALGELMAAVRHSRDDFDDWLLAATDEEIDQAITSRSS